MSSDCPENTLPPNWKSIRLGDFGEWSGGGTPTKSNPLYWDGGTIPWVSPKDMKYFLIHDTQDRITELALMESNTKLVEEQSVLMVTRSGILAHSFPVAINTVPVTVNQDLKVLKPSAAVDPKYVGYCLHSRQHDVLSKCAKDGVTVASLETEQLKDYKVPTAPLPEQHRIVEAIESYLTRIDDAIANLERVERNLKRYRASVLKAAVEGRLVPTEAELARQQGRDYEPATELLARILTERRQRWIDAEAEKIRAKAEAKARAQGKPWTDEDDRKALAKARQKAADKYKEPQAPDTSTLPELPEGWCWATVEQLCWDGSYGTSQKCEPGADGPPVLRIPNVQDERLDFDNLKYATDESKLNPNLSLKIGDFIFIRTNGSKNLVGRGAPIFELPSGIFFFASYLIRLRLANPKCLSWFAHVWNSDVVRSQVLGNAASSAGQYNVSLSAANGYFVPLPPLAEQRRLCEKIDELYSVSEQTQVSIACEARKLTRLRQSILKWAFEGKLVDQNPNDEPASVLLARIRAQRAAAAPPAKTRKRRKTASRADG